LTGKVIGMRLELAYYHIKALGFGPRTKMEDGVLTLCAEELIGLLREDQRLAGIGLEIASPGEDTRIINVLDVVEPRIKSGGPGGVFPGLLGRAEIVGRGRTLALKGVGVVNTGYVDINWEGIIDMRWEGETLSPYASLHNLVLVPSPASGLEPREFMDAIMLAGLKAAEYLARPALGLEPDEVEVFESAPLTRAAALNTELPRVAYL